MKGSKGVLPDRARRNIEKSVTIGRFLVSEWVHRPAGFLSIGFVFDETPGYLSPSLDSLCAHFVKRASIRHVVSLLPSLYCSTSRYLVARDCIRREFEGLTLEKLGLGSRDLTNLPLSLIMLISIVLSSLYQAVRSKALLFSPVVDR